MPRRAYSISVGGICGGGGNRTLVPSRPHAVFGWSTTGHPRGGGARRAGSRSRKPLPSASTGAGDPGGACGGSTPLPTRSQQAASTRYPAGARTVVPSHRGGLRYRTQHSHLSLVQAGRLLPPTHPASNQFPSAGSSMAGGTTGAGEVSHLDHTAPSGCSRCGVTTAWLAARGVTTARRPFAVQAPGVSRHRGALPSEQPDGSYCFGGLGTGLPAASAAFRNSMTRLTMGTSPVCLPAAVVRSTNFPCGPFCATQCR